MNVKINNTMQFLTLLVFLGFLYIDSSSSSIHFNVQDPSASFYGRENVLKDLGDSIDATLVKRNVIESPKQSTRLKLVIGRKGSGKTDMVRKYINLHSPQFHNVVWIKANDRHTLENSFLVLAAQPQIQIDRKHLGPGPGSGPEGDEKTLRNLVQEIYWRFGNDSSNSDHQIRTLIIMDAAQNYSGPNGIEPFLPEEVNSHSPIIIVTTANPHPEDWHCGLQDIFPVTMFTMEESVGYILSQLSSISVIYSHIPGRTLEVTKKEARDLAQGLRRKPLCLDLAMSFIIQNQKEKQEQQQQQKSNPNQDSERPPQSPISDYLKRLEKSRLKLPSVSYNDTVSASLFVTLNKLDTIKMTSPLTSEGQWEIRNLPRHLMDALAMLSAGQHAIPVQLLHEIFTPAEEYDEEGNKKPRTINPEDVVAVVDGALSLLGDYGLITSVTNYRSERRSHFDLGFQIHGLYELVLFKELKKSPEKLAETWKIIAEALNRILMRDLKTDRLQDFTSDSLGLWSIMTTFVDRRKPDDLKISAFLQEAGADHQFMSLEMHLALGLYFSSVSAEPMPIAEEEHGLLLYAIENIAFQRKAKSLLHLVVKELKIIVDDFMQNDWTTNKRKVLNVPKMIFAYRSPKYLNLHQTVYDLFQKTFGDTNTFTIYALEKLAAAYNESGHLDQAVTLYKTIFHMQQKEHGIGEEVTLRALQDLGHILLRQKNYDDALKMFKEAYKIGIIALGDEHTLPLQPFLHMLQTLTQEGDYPRALGVAQLILDLQKETLGLQPGDDGIDPRILATLEKMADLFDKIGKTEKALKIYERLLKAHQEKVKTDQELYDQSNLESNPDLNVNLELDELERWRILSLLGETHEKLGNVRKALRIFKEVWEGRKKKLGENHENTIHSHAKLTHLWYQNEDFENARNAVDRVLERQKLVLGYQDSHPEVVKMLETKRLVQKKLDQMASESEPQKHKLPVDEL